MSNSLRKKENESIEPMFQKLYYISESVEPLSRNGEPNMAQNLHAWMICCRPGVVYDEISGRNSKTIEGYPVVNFEL